MNEAEKYKKIAVIPAFNEEDRLGKILDKFSTEIIDKVLVVDDGSTDRTAEEARNRGVRVISQEKRTGVGAAIRRGIDYAIENGYDIIVVMAANGKDNPEEIPLLLKPIITDQADYVQGSRYLKGGRSDNTPFLRILAIKMYTLMWSLLLWRRFTDVTNGFRAYRRTLFDDKRINLWQDWLDTYELEYYLHYQVVKLGYRFKEVPVSKIYHAALKRNYTKIRPGRDWWNIVKPLIYLWTCLKK